MKSFESLGNEFDWEEIPNCPGRYRFKEGRVRTHPRELAGPATRAIDGSSERCRDPFIVVPLSDGGGLLSYRDADGSYLHTLNSAAGLKRKLQDLGVLLEGDSLRPL